MVSLPSSYISARPRLPGVAVAAAAALAVEMTTHLVDFGVYDLRVRVINSSLEVSYPHWLVTAATALATLAAVVATRRGAAPRAAWTAASVVLTFLLVDKVLGLHDRIPHWEALYAPALAVLVFALWSLAGSFSGREAALLRVGISLLVFSLAVHVAGPTLVRELGWSPDGWAYQVKVALKEGTELAGWVLVALLLARSALPARAAPQRRPSRIS